MKLLVIGGRGQLGREIGRRAGSRGYDLVSVDIPEVDITNKSNIRECVLSCRPSLIINCAAFTQVDLAESEVDRAFGVNREGSRNVAAAAEQAGAHLLHISTDYVFDGTANSSVTEDAIPSPVNLYGSSKLAGEREVLDILGERAVIVRTASLHGQYGPNFVHAMLELFKRGGVFKVVNDQTMSPTWAGWLADALLDLARIRCNGIVHAVGQGEVTWYGFACKIIELVALSGVEYAAEVVPCSTAEFPRPAKRPRYSVLSTKKLNALLGKVPMSWQDGLRHHLKDLGYELPMEVI